MRSAGESEVFSLIYATALERYGAWISTHNPSVNSLRTCWLSCCHRLDLATLQDAFRLRMKMRRSTTFVRLTCGRLHRASRGDVGWTLCNVAPFDAIIRPASPSGCEDSPRNIFTA